MRGWRLDDPNAEIITRIFPASNSGAEYEEINGKPVERVTSLIYCPTEEDSEESKTCGVILVGAVDMEEITLPIDKIAEWLPLVESHRRDKDHSERDRMVVR